MGKKRVIKKGNQKMPKKISIDQINQLRANFSDDKHTKIVRNAMSSAAKHTASAVARRLVLGGASQGVRTRRSQSEGLGW